MDRQFLSHSHQDIGYTPPMDGCSLRAIWRRWIDLARWDEGHPRRPALLNTEATWSIAGNLKAYAGTDKAARLIRAVRDGVINIDAPLG